MVPLVVRTVRSVATERHFAIGISRCWGSIRWNRFSHRCRISARILADKFSHILWMWMRPDTVSLAQWTYVCRNSLCAYGIQNDTVYCRRRKRTMAHLYHNRHRIERLSHSFSAKRPPHASHTSSASVHIGCDKRYRRNRKRDHSHCLCWNICPCIGIPTIWVLCMRRREPNSRHVWIEKKKKKMLINSDANDDREETMNDYIYWRDKPYRQVACARSHSVLYVFESVPHR